MRQPLVSERSMLPLAKSGLSMSGVWKGQHAPHQNIGLASRLSPHLLKAACLSSLSELHADTKTASHA